MKNMLTIIVLLFCSFCSCDFFEPLVDLSPPQTGGELMMDAYMPAVTINNPADTLVSVDTAYYHIEGDTVTVEAVFRLATLVSPGQTQINQVRYSLPVPTGFSQNAWLTSWNHNQYALQNQNANYESVTAKGFPGPGGYMQVELELKRELIQYLNYPENLFEFQVEFKYIIN